ncbi:MAG TPA: HlyD family secretion protein [Verrucomicrobiae bacterium]|nr:HlyD family secretion protein [Verrucomicrobiae bacterium]
MNTENQASATTTSGPASTTVPDIRRANGGRRQRFFWIAIVAVPLLLVALGLYYFFEVRPYETTDDAFIDGHAIQVSPQVAGHVLQVFIRDNQVVKKGDPLVKIDPRDFDARLAAARAGLAAARSRVAQANSQLAVTQATAEQDRAAVAAAQAEAERAQADLARYQSVEKRAVSREQVDAAVAAGQSTAASLEVARKKADAAEAQVGLSRALIATAEADVQRAEADVQQAELNRSYAEIDAPEDGWVTRRVVEEGEYVQVGQALLAVVEPNPWVTANFKETQLSLMKPGQPVEIRVDAFPQKDFKGHVDSIQAGTGAHFSLLPPENAVGNYVKVVQRVPVKIVFDEGEDPKFPLPLGASVVPKVKVQ